MPQANSTISMPRLHAGPGFGERFAVLAGDEGGQLVEVFFHQRAVAEHPRPPFLGDKRPPWRSLFGAAYRTLPPRGGGEDLPRPPVRLFPLGTLGAGLWLRPWPSEHLPKKRLNTCESSGNPRIILEIPLGFYSAANTFQGLFHGT